MARLVATTTRLQWQMRHEPSVGDPGWNNRARDDGCNDEGVLALRDDLM